jgi:hypothetical protein
MPKSTGPVERRARSLCVELARVTADTPMEYQMVRLIARLVAIDYETADAAIARAVGQGWVIVEAGRSICLTDAARRLVNVTRQWQT